MCQVFVAGAPRGSLDRNTNQTVLNVAPVQALAGESSVNLDILVSAMGHISAGGGAKFDTKGLQSSHVVFNGTAADRKDAQPAI